MRRNRFDSIDADQERKDQSPIPIAVTFRNLYVPISCNLEDEYDDKVQGEEESMYHSNRWTKHLPHHKALLSVELEIIVSNQCINHLNERYKTKFSKKILKKLFGKYDRFNGTRMGDDQDVVILYQKIIERPTSHLLWDHLEDKLDDFYASIPVSTSDTEEDISVRTNIWNDIQMSMKIRCKAYIPTPTFISRRKSSVDDMEHEKKFSMHSIVLSTIDLDINRLKVLPQSIQALNSAFVLPPSKYHSSLPSALPHNTFLIHFSDGTTRTSIEIYDILLDQKIIIGEVANRFDDKVFNVLEEQIEYTKAKLSMNKLSVSSTKQVIQKGNNINGDAILKRDIPHQITPNKKTNQGAFVDAFESVSSSVNTSRNNSRHGNPIVLSDDGIYDQSESYDSNSLDSSDEIDSSKLNVVETDELKLQNIDNEIQILNDILKRSQQEVEDQLSLQKQLTTNLGDLTNAIDELEHNVSLIKQHSNSVSEQNASLEVIVSNRKKKLIRDLKLLYPIQSLPDGMYTIRGIPLPIDMHSLVASEEVISAGLGFVSHLVTMCSKYLEVPLRYRLICNSSRSAVRDDNFDVYPLFKERVIEKEQFDRGMVLLHRNIDHLLDVQNIPQQIRSNHPHILSKLLLIFD